MVNVDLHPWKSILELIIVLPKQQYNIPEKIAKYDPSVSIA